MPRPGASNVSVKQSDFAENKDCKTVKFFKVNAFTNCAQEVNNRKFPGNH